MHHSQILFWSALATFLQITTGLVNVVKSRTGQSTVRYKTWLPGDDFLCHGQRAQHTGWADFNNRHLFFWFHESQRGPDAPLLIWFQGGPGGSSLHGMLFENGPCLIRDVNSTVFNPYSWTNYFNVVYLDQPAGVGYSYVDDPTDESTYPGHVRDSSLDVVAFINLFYEAFPNMKLVDLHLGGESYAGRYVPSAGAAILEYNQFFTQNSSNRSQDPTIYLRSLLVGNPLFNPAIQLPTLYDVSCHEYRGKYPPHFDAVDCAEVKMVIDQCEALLHACAHDKKSRYLCTQASELCFTRYMKKFVQYHRSSYDRRLRDCRGDGDCYPDVDYIISYLNSQKVINDKLEVSRLSGGRKGQWDMMSEIILSRYLTSGDMWTPTTDAIERILDYSSNLTPTTGLAPVDILFYVGVADVICNADGVLAGMLDLYWQGHTEFRSTPWKELPWNSSLGNIAGRVKMSSNLWIAEIEDAGHMVPYDQPESSLKMVHSWLHYVYNGTLSWDTEAAVSPLPPVDRKKISSSDWRFSIGDAEL